MPSIEPEEESYVERPWQTMKEQILDNQKMTSFGRSMAA